MAPHAEEVGFLSDQRQTTEDSKAPKLSDTYEPGRIPPVPLEAYEYEDLGPHFPEFKWEALKNTPYEDKGLLGDARFRSLLDAAQDVFDHVPKIGTEIVGVQLSQLTTAQKNDLARLVATRGVVFFRDQQDFDIDAQRNLGRYFGTLHRHATTAMPHRPGLEDVHVVHTTAQSLNQRALFTATYLWHSDVSLKALAAPAA
jgi:sulfonate dioxygenase